MSGITRGPWRLSNLNKCRADVSGLGWEKLASVVVRMEGDQKHDPEGLANARAIVEVPTFIAETEADIRDLEFCVAVMGKTWPDKAEHLSRRLRDKRALLDRIKGAE